MLDSNDDRYIWCYRKRNSDTLYLLLDLESLSGHFWNVTD